MFNKLAFILLFVFLSCLGFSQNDSSETRGTIKIVKVKNSTVYIKASAEFYDYDFRKLKNDFSNNDIFQPFPVVDGQAFPFNYTKYFKDKFKGQEINLQGRISDTVIIGLRILSNGKVFLNDQKQFPKGIDQLQVYSFVFLNAIRIWQPAYVMVRRRSKFKGQTVIKPYKKNVASSGRVTIIFSTEELDN